jgi:serine/threonine-protein kinase HipA
LLGVGGDTVGDVRVAPAGEVPVSPAPRFDPADAGTVRFADLIAESAGAAPERVGLPGVQEKVSARTANAPVRRGALSDAILKFDVGEFPLLVANEALCLDLAAAAGLPAAEHTVVRDMGDEPGLLVRRFDRTTGDDGEVRARGQQDACQTLGLWPADKYRPDLVDVVVGLARVCRAPAVAALRLWEQVVFSLIVANGDQHAKNLAIVHDGEGWMPSPAYDVVFTHPYGDTDTLALPLAGERRAPRIDRRHVLGAAEQTGVPQPALGRRIDRMLAATRDVPARLSELPFPGARPAKLRRVLDQRRAKLA